MAWQSNYEAIYNSTYGESPWGAASGLRSWSFWWLQTSLLSLFLVLFGWNFNVGVGVDFAGVNWQVDRNYGQNLSGHKSGPGPSMVNSYGQFTPASSDTNRRDMRSHPKKVISSSQMQLLGGTPPYTLQFYTFYQIPCLMLSFCPIYCCPNPGKIGIWSWSGLWHGFWVDIRPSQWRGHISMDVEQCENHPGKTILIFLMYGSWKRREWSGAVVAGGGGAAQSPPGPATVNMWPRTSLLLLLLGTLASHALDVDQGYTDEEADAVVIEGRSLAAAGHAVQPLNQPAFCKISWHWKSVYVTFYGQFLPIHSMFRMKMFS